MNTCKQLPNEVCIKKFNRRASSKVGDGTLAGEPRNNNPNRILLDSFPLRGLI